MFYKFGSSRPFGYQIWSHHGSRGDIWGENFAGKRDRCSILLNKTSMLTSRWSYYSKCWGWRDQLFNLLVILLKFRWFLRQKAIQKDIQMNLKNISHSRVESFNGIYWFSLNWNLCWSECRARKQQSKCFHRCSTFSFNWNRDI